VAALLEALRPVLALLLGVVIDLFRQRPQSTAEDGKTDPTLRERLRKRVRRTWGKALIIGAVLLLLPGCATRTIYVRNGEPVRLRETVHSAKVWVLDAEGKPTPGVMDLSEGWYCLPEPKDDDGPEARERD
jgi:hypothetical protein